MSYIIKLTRDGQQDLESRMSTTKDKRIYIRLLTVKLRSERKKNYEIAEVLNVSTSTITNWIVLYLEGGFEGLCQLKYPPGKSSLDPVKGELLKFISENNVNCREIRDYLKSAHKIDLASDTIRKYIKKEFDYSFKKQD